MVPSWDGVDVFRLRLPLTRGRGAKRIIAGGPGASGASARSPGPPPGSRAPVEAAYLVAVSAAGHRAPPAAPIARGVEEQPSALRVAALANVRAVVRRQ